MVNNLQEQEFTGFFDFSDCRVVVKESDRDEVYFESTVLIHDRHYHNIRVSAPRGTKGRDKVSVVIFTEQEVVRYMGTMRRTGMAGVMEIALYAGETKEDRQAKRYTVNLPATVNGMVFSDQLVELEKPLEVIAGNISTSGVMLVAPSSSFYSDNIVRINIDTEKMKTVLFGLVVRVRSLGEGFDEFGCKFVNFQESESSKEAGQHDPLDSEQELDEPQIL